MILEWGRLWEWWNDSYEDYKENYVEDKYENGENENDKGIGMSMMTFMRMMININVPLILQVKDVIFLCGQNIYSAISSGFSWR